MYISVLKTKTQVLKLNHCQYINLAVQHKFTTINTPAAWPALCIYYTVSETYHSLAWVMHAIVGSRMASIRGGVREVIQHAVCQPNSGKNPLERT